MSSFDDVQGVVLDCGSKLTKAGFIGDHFPRAVIPTVVGRFRHAGLFDGFPEIYAGDEAISKRGLSELTWPVVDGLINDWDEIEKFWFHVFYKELHVPPEQTRVLHSTGPLVTNKHKERMTEIFFESFAVRGLTLVKSPVLSLYASGRTTGVVFQSGASSSFVTPVFEGFALTHAIVPTHFTGDAMSDRLTNLFKNIGYSFTTPIEMQIVDDIKAKLCYVTENYEKECKKFASSANQVEYVLPDGQKILVGEERFKCPEAMFQPSVAGLTCPSIVDAVMECIDKQCDIDIKPQMFNNIVVAGGSTLFRGLIPRLRLELKQRLKGEIYTAHVENLVSREVATWVGGSMVAQQSNLKGFWLTKQEYEDIGLHRINHKFI